MPQSTDRFDATRALFLDRLVKSMKKAPGMRLGQLIVEALSGTPAPEGVEPFVVVTLRHIEDAQLAEAIERYLMTRVP